MTDIGGVILAGGLSRRMEGPEKSLMALAGTPLIERVAQRLEKQVSPIIVNANGDPERFAFLEKPIHSDTIEGFAGPLAGVLAGLTWSAQNTKMDWIITAAADTPFFPMDYVECLRKVSTGKKVVLASSDNRRHPVFGLWHVSLKDDLETFLKSGDRKVMLFVQNYENDQVEFPVEKIDPFFNVNTPEDWEKAERLATEMKHHD